MAKKKNKTERQRTDRGEGDVLQAVQLFDKFGEPVFTGSYVGEPLAQLPDSVFKETTTQEFLDALAAGDYETFDLGVATGEFYKEGEV